MAREETRSPRASTGKRRRTAESALAIKGDHAAAGASGGSCCSTPSASSLCCGICLSSAGERPIRGIIDCCDHYFCFTCIREWGKVESKCPMCKRRFYSIRRPAVAGIFPTERIVDVPVRDQRPPDDSMNSFGVSTPYRGWPPFSGDGSGYTSRENSDVGLVPLVSVRVFESWSHSYGASYHGDANRGRHGSGSGQYNEDSAGIPEQTNHYDDQDDRARSAMDTDSSSEEEHDGSGGLDLPGQRDESPRHSPSRRDESAWFSPSLRDESALYSPSRRFDSPQYSPSQRIESPRYSPSRTSESLRWFDCRRYSPSRRIQSPRYSPSRRSESPRWFDCRRYSPSRRFDSSRYSPSRRDESPRYSPSRRDESPRYSPSRRDESPRYSPSRRDESLQYSPSRRFDSPRYSPSRSAACPRYSPYGRFDSPQYSPCRRAESPWYSPYRRAESPRYSPYRRVESPPHSPHRGDESRPYHRGRRYGSRSDRSSSSSGSNSDGRDDNDRIDYDGESSHYSDQEGDTRCQTGTDSGQDPDGSSGADIPYWGADSESRSTRGSTDDDREQDESWTNGSNSNDNSYDDDHADYSKESSHYSDRDDANHSQTETDSREEHDRSSDSKSLNHGTESPSYSRRNSRRETQSSSRRRDETWSNRTGSINGTWVASGSSSQPSLLTPSYSDADRHRESPSPARRSSPETGNRSLRSSRDHETCVDFHGFQIPRNQIKYLKAVYDRQGAFWEDSVVYSRSIRTAALSSLGEVLVLAGSDWSSLSKEDLEHIVRTANDLYNFGFRLSFFDSLVEKCNKRLNLLSKIEDLSIKKADMECRVSRMGRKLNKLDKDLDEVRGGSPLPPFLAF